MFHDLSFSYIIVYAASYRNVFGVIGESTYIGRGYEAGCGVGGDWWV